MDLILYHGQVSIDQDQQGAQAHAVVMQLLRPPGNWYIFISLFNDLFKKKFSVTRTLRLNRKGVPAPIMKTKLEKGESICVRNKHPFIKKWCDKRDMLMISTRHNLDFEMNTWKNTKKTRLKPSCIVEYNSNMGGVDKVTKRLHIIVGLHHVKL